MTAKIEAIYKFFKSERPINSTILNRPPITSGRHLYGLTTEDAILDELRKINEVLARLDGCIDDNNHRHKMCLKTGHWNDS
jgi:hypothetical protein